MPTILRLSWLGSPAIEYDGRPLRLEMRKTLALLTYLSLSPQSPSRETLATLFWPEFSQQHSLSNLRRNLFSLVKSLPHGLLEIDRERIGLRRENWLQMDVEEFLEQLSTVKEHSHPPGLVCPECLSSLKKAVELYKGDFLEGFNLKDCPEFDEWQYLQRESLRSEYAGALEKLAAYYRGQGEWEKAIRNTRSWVALDPLNEPAQQMLIRLYNQSGQRNLALRQYKTLIDLLKNELGQSLDAETLSLYQSLLSPDISGDAETGLAHGHSTSREPEPLIKTKLFIPPLRGNLVTRPRLLELLDAGSQRSLTLVSAPAGFGKTTLLASWVAHTSLPIAWFSIDDGDNDPARFIAYLIAALDSILSGVSEQFQPLTQSLMPSIQSIFARLINHLAAESDPFVLILDDYQFIHSQDIHKALTFLLEKIPACMHLVIGTRTDPPISLARLRGRDQLVEIRMSDLRFSLEESDGFLRQVMSLHLTDEDISALEARTEGWIAGLQMAALAIRTVASQSNRETNEADSRQTISKYIQVFSGSNRYILDYLCEEVLNHRPKETRSFLLQTSILERFSGSLCDAVTGNEGGQMILEELEKENIFLVPMDSERHWYRYHHLFAELLRFKLEEALFEGSGTGGEGLPSQEELHLRAADWFDKDRFFGEAVHHYIAARKFDQAAALIEAQAYPFIFTSGQAYTLMEWLAELPADLFRSRPRLNIAKAWTLMAQDQFTTAKELLETSWQVLQERQDKEADRIIGEIALVRGTLAELTSRDVEGMRVQGLLAWEKLPQEDSMLRGLAAWLLGASYLFDGDTQHAEHYLTQAIQLCREAGNIYFTSVAVQELGIVRMEQGKYHEAYQLLQQTLQEMSSGGRQAHPSLGYLYRVVGLILFDWNQLEKAERAFTISIDLVAQDIPGEMLIMNTSMLPYLKLAQGKREKALRLAEDCIQRVETYPLPYIPAIIKANLIRFWIRVGERDRVEGWLRSCGLSPDDTVRCVDDAQYIALAKVLIWQGRAEEALKVLAQLHDLTQSQGRNGKLFYVLALQALALKQSNDLDQALRTLGTSLVLAQSEGYIRPYVEEGQPMEELLELGAAQGRWQQTYLDGYVNRLLKAIHQDQAWLDGFVGT
jgi:LuxR family transcriptional regulator, maltose regulon positive regulatory protein